MLLLYRFRVQSYSFSGAKLRKFSKKTQKVALKFEYFLRNSKEMSTFAPQNVEFEQINNYKKQ